MTSLPPIDGENNKLAGEDERWQFRDERKDGGRGKRMSAPQKIENAAWGWGLSRVRVWVGIYTTSSIRVDGWIEI